MVNGKPALLHKDLVLAPQLAAFVTKIHKFAVLFCSRFWICSSSYWVKSIKFDKFHHLLSFSKDGASMENYWSNMKVSQKSEKVGSQWSQVVQEAQISLSLSAQNIEKNKYSGWVRGRGEQYNTLSSLRMCVLMKHIKNSYCFKKYFRKYPKIH